MKDKLPILVFFLMVLGAVLLYFTRQESECERRGGLLRGGIIGYRCVERDP